MDINILEEKLESFEDLNYLSIIEMFIIAVKEYPFLELKDTDIYIAEVKKRLNQESITVNNLKRYIDSNSNKDDVENMWVNTSLTSLLEAFELMQLYKLSFDNVYKKMYEIFNSKSQK